ncbi:organic hydroperoxide resistance protein [Micromonospora sp. NBC_01638]|nr:organic hydroperoxide resistance protein [Micromonospora sp. NBC_01638]
MTTQLDRVTYTATATATGGRAGNVRSDDGFLDVDLRAPKEMGGPGGATNPEQLFAAGYAACFQASIGAAGRRMKVDTSGSLVTCHVSMGPVGTGYGLAVRLVVEIPNVDEATCQKLTEEAHQICPYSAATRGNIEVDIQARPAG